MSLQAGAAPLCVDGCGRPAARRESPRGDRPDPWALYHSRCAACFAVLVEQRRLAAARVREAFADDPGSVRFAKGRKDWRCLLCGTPLPAGVYHAALVVSDGQGRFDRWRICVPCDEVVRPRRQPEALRARVREMFVAARAWVRHSKARKQWECLLCDAVIPPGAIYAAIDVPEGPRARRKIPFRICLVCDEMTAAE